MSYKIALALFIGLLMVGCQSKVEVAQLSDQDQRNLTHVTKEHVALFAGPPMIPAGHEFVIGEDVADYENGGGACLDCHNDPDEEDIPQTRHPERHACLQCHLPQMDETAQTGDFKVDNSFVKYVPRGGR